MMDGMAARARASVSKPELASAAASQARILRAGPRLVQEQLSTIMADTGPWDDSSLNMIACMLLGRVLLKGAVPVADRMIEEDFDTFAQHVCNLSITRRKASFCSCLANKSLR